MASLTATMQDGGKSVAIIPGSSDTVLHVILSGSYTGFSGVFEWSADQVTFPNNLLGINANGYPNNGGSPYTNPKDNSTQVYLFNISGSVNKACQLRALSYGSGLVNVAMCTGIIAGGFVAPPGQGARADASQNASGAASTLTLTMPAVSGKINYVTGITVDGNGATASTLIAASLSNVVTGTLRFPALIPAGAAVPLGAFRINIDFDTPIPATQPNQSVVLSVPSFGTGNTLATAQLRGYVQ